MFLPAPAASWHVQRSMEYRRLGPDDLESCLACRLRALEHSPSSFLVTLAEEREGGRARLASTLSQSDAEHAIFGAFDAERLVAVLGIRRGERTRIRHRAMIWGMYVDADVRGRGVGGKLLDLALEHGRARMQVDVVSLEVESSNAAAKALYVSRGFRCWGSEPRALRIDGADRDEDHMLLELD